VDESATALAAAVERAVPAWVERSVVLRGGTGLRDAARAAGDRARADVGAALRELLAADVDEQRTTPLTLLRDAVRYPTAVLRDAGVAPVPRDRFAAERFPDDPYDLTPATWSDVDPELVDVGLAWGAWKAMAHRARHGGG
jgi:hypothetical protein